MNGLALYDAGYTALVSVIPPDAELSRNSRVNPSDLGKVPGKRGRKGWHGYNFVTAPEPSREDVAGWLEDGANVGILAARYPALDVDVKSEKLARAVTAFASKVLGPAPVRLSREPRRLLVYRTEAPFARRAVIIEYEGEHHLVEFLGEGRQYLVAGRHPAGLDYRWDGTPLAETPPAELVPVTAESVDAFFDRLQAALAEKGIRSERVGGKPAATSSVPQESLEAPSIEMLEALPLPPNPDDFGWDEFIMHGYAYRAAGRADEATAYACWLRWSEQHPKHDETTCEREWAKLERVTTARVGWNWLQERAAEAGDYNPAEDDFEADPALAHRAAEILERQAADAEASAAVAATDRVRFSDEWATDKILPSVRERLRYVPGKGEESGTWMLWDVYRWRGSDRLEHELVVRELLRRLSMRLQAAADNAPSKAEGKEFAAAAKRLQSRDGIRAVTALCRAHIAVQPVDFDTNPLLLNTPGGVIDLRNGERHDGRPEGMHARSTVAAPRRGLSPLWNQFLDDLTGRDEEFKRFLQRYVGYMLTGIISEKVLGYVWGANSDTGKSTFLKILTRLFGSYADSVDVNVFLQQKKAGQIPAELARLPGVRLVTATEPEAGTAWDQKRIYQITGSDPIEVRFLYGNPFTYEPQFSILMAGNHEPVLRNVDDAARRRFLILPMNRKVPREKQIGNLVDRIIEEEGGAVLQWAIDGCLLWKREGLAPPPVVLATTAEYFDEQDTLAQWAAEELEVDADAVVSRHTLYVAWSQWKHSRDEYAGKEGNFKQTFAPIAERYKLEEAMVQEGEKRRRGYRGIRLRLRVAMGTAAEDFAA